MSHVSLLTFLAAAANGLLAGVSFEVATVKLPARRHLGAIPFAHFARGADLANGKAIYPALAATAALLTFGATVSAYVRDGALVSKVPALVLASIGTILHFAATAKAAPIMLSIGTAPEEERVLESRLASFARWHAVRAALQILTFLFALWAVAS